MQRINSNKSKHSNYSCAEQTLREAIEWLGPDARIVKMFREQVEQERWKDGKVERDEIYIVSTIRRFRKRE